MQFTSKPPRARHVATGAAAAALAAGAPGVDASVLGRFRDRAARFAAPEEDFHHVQVEGRG